MAELRLPETSFSRRIDALIRKLGRGLGLLWLALIVVIMVNVICRYVFSEGFIQLEELQWHLYATGFLLGLSYAVTEDSHVRVDVLRSRWSDETIAWIECYGLLLLLLPFVILVLFASGPFVLYAFETAEVSQSPGGVPLRWVIKMMLPLGFVLLMLATLGRLSRVLAFLFYGDAPNGEASRND